MSKDRAPLRFKSPSQGVRRLWRSTSLSDAGRGESPAKRTDSAFQGDHFSMSSFTSKADFTQAGDPATQHGAAKMARDLGAAQQQLEGAKDMTKELRDQLGMVAADRQRTTRDLKLAHLRIRDLETRNQRMKQQLDAAVGERAAAQQVAVLRTREVDMLQMRIKELEVQNRRLESELVNAVDDQATAQQTAAKAVRDLELLQQRSKDFDLINRKVMEQLEAAVMDAAAARQSAAKATKELDALQKEAEALRSSNRSMQQQLGVAAHAVTSAAAAAMAARSENETQLHELKERVVHLERELEAAAAERKLLRYLQQQAAQLMREAEVWELQQEQELQQAQQQEQAQQQQQEQQQGAEADAEAAAAEQRARRQQEQERRWQQQMQVWQQEQQRMQQRQLDHERQSTLAHAQQRQQQVQQLLVHQQQQQKEQQQQQQMGLLTQESSIAWEASEGALGGKGQGESLEAVLAAGAALAAEVAAAAARSHLEQAQTFPAAAECLHTTSTGCSDDAFSDDESSPPSIAGSNLDRYVLDYDELEGMLLQRGHGLDTDVTVDSCQDVLMLLQGRDSSTDCMSEASEFFELVVEDGAPGEKHATDAASERCTGRSGAWTERSCMQVAA